MLHTSECAVEYLFRITAPAHELSTEWEAARSQMGEFLDSRCVSILLRLKEKAYHSLCNLLMCCSLLEVGDEYEPHTIPNVVSSSRRFNQAFSGRLRVGSLVLSLRSGFEHMVLRSRRARQEQQVETQYFSRSHK